MTLLVWGQSNFSSPDFYCAVFIEDNNHYPLLGTKQQNKYPFFQIQQLLPCSVFKQNEERNHSSLLLGLFKMTLTYNSPFYTIPHIMYETRGTLPGAPPFFSMDQCSDTKIQRGDDVTY